MRGLPTNILFWVTNLAQDLFLTLTSTELYCLEMISTLELSNYNVSILIAGFALVYGNPLRLIHGYDSFGNTCGSSYNDQLLTNGNLSGINTVNKRYLFFMDVRNIRNSLQICVEKCPDRNIDTIQELKLFYDQTGSNLCR
ncbi:hypothetical protein J6590_023792 [Homalodisca vitripennis]|nr:hypothetical protein J6590_023792 [Homalodisca vitripennis]